MPVLEPHTFESDLAWSLSTSNTSAAVRLLHEVWPARSWVLCCHSTDRAGCDLLGLREDKQPIRVDLKLRRGVPVDPTNPDCVFDVGYISDGKKSLAPILRPEPLPVDYFLHCWPAAEPPIGALVEARRSQIWLQGYWTALKRYSSVSDREAGAQWSTVFVAPSVELLAAAGDGVVRLIRL